jgi:hypothetical protein
MLVQYVQSGTTIATRSFPGNGTSECLTPGKPCAIMSLRLLVPFLEDV